MLLSLQLYSARNAGAFPETITALGAMGYDAVEVFGPNLDAPDATRAAAEAAGLSIPSAHVALDLCEKDPEGVAELCQQMGVTRVFAPYLMPEDRPTDAAGWEALAGRLAAIQPRLAAHGISFGWHNHDFEITPLADGTVPMQVILDTAPDLDWEADIAWIVKGGGDPLDWIERYGARITAAHFKDIAPEGEKTDEDGWADPGTGTMDWPAIAAALKAKTPCTLLVAEHDNPSDFARFARAAAELGTSLK